MEIMSLNFCLLMLISLLVLNSMFFILMLTFILAMCVGMKMYLTNSSWLALMMLLVYVGGLLMLFFYMCSLSSKIVFKTLNVSSLFLMVIMTKIYFFSLNQGFSNSIKYSSLSDSESLSSDLWMMMVFLLMGLLSLTKMKLYKKFTVRPEF